MFLKKENINIRVVDCFTIKPMDGETMYESIRASNNLGLVVEDHYKEGGIFESVCAELGLKTDVKIHSVAVDSVPRSGTAKDLLDFYGLSCDEIVKKVKELLA